ncbi:AAA family ATPase [Jiella sonneratiae]|uniref:MoxR family ATPase n=1 Tax=Jiella sonneratiae TaxID=2816856 RepID=A0ABS3J789_9HYPH|nr:MoxR family ATPase [Jiella sonneratiae]MBO0905502.1 MoxR family ATPase [Jiella sonneratiae]
MNLDELRALRDRIAAEIEKAVQGQAAVVELLLVSLFARGHCLIEGPPGTAKTLLAQSLAAAVTLDFKRLQFTPDLMPGDVIGSNVYDFGSRRFELVKGPIFTDILLSDEINRAPPKTQAALLQVMNERRVTIDGVDHAVGNVFFVVATQNPIEQQGTYPLPEAQLDRFLFKVEIAFPDEEAELSILRRHAGQPLDHDARKAAIEPVAGLGEIRAGQELVDAIRLDDEILRYVLGLCRATRADVDIAYGVSTRAADALCGAVRARAALDGRDYAIPDDVKLLFGPTMRHRVVLSPTAEIEGRSPDSVLAALVEQIPAPR